MVSVFQRVWVVVPTYNERDNLEPLVSSIRNSAPFIHQILFVDDASPDGTADKAETMPGVMVLRRQGPRGYGYSMRDGIQLALQSGADAIVTMDADLSHDATIIPQMLDGLSEADVVVGSRYCRSHPLIENWSRRRLFISQLATSLVRGCTGVALGDPTSGYRCWSVPHLKRMDLDGINSGGFAFLYESLFYAKQAGGTFLEVPNVYRGRIHGESKLSLRIIMEAVRLLPRLLVKRSLKFS
jgi:dolichol-phosphate mannosyltransferase